MRKELLMRVRDKILTQPEHFDMSSWFIVHNGDVDLEDTVDLEDVEQIHIEDCGTTACIAGWVVLLDDSAPAEKGSFASELARWLGVPHQLFFRTQWPKEYAFWYDQNDPRIADLTEAEKAAELIQRLVDGDDPWAND